MPNLVNDLKKNINDVLKLRDDIGVLKDHVYFFTRSWSGEVIGSGTKTDSEVIMYPSPRIVDYSHDLRLKEGGKIQDGDLILKSVSKQSYPDEKDIDCIVNQKNVEKFFRIGQKLYTVVHVKSKYVTWEIHLRITSKKI